MAEIKVVSGRTIIKKITVGVPVRAVKSFAISTAIGQLSDVKVAGGRFRDGYVLHFDSASQEFRGDGILNLQRIDGGDTFDLDSLPPGTINQATVYTKSAN